MAYIRPYSDLDVQLKVLIPFQVVPSLHGSGQQAWPDVNCESVWIFVAPSYVTIAYRRVALLKIDDVVRIMMAFASVALSLALEVPVQQPCECLRVNRSTL